MAVADALGYRLPTPNRLQRYMRRLASSAPGAWLFSRTMPHVDRSLLRITRGRLALPAIAAGIPVLTLVTVGAKSGSRRATPLLGIPHGDAIAVIGTQFGQPGTPSWYHNLRANPRAELIYAGKSVAVEAREADGEEWQGIWDRGRMFYSGYDSYAERLGSRPIHIMILTEATG